MDSQSKPDTQARKPKFGITPPDGSELDRGASLPGSGHANTTPVDTAGSPSSYSLRSTVKEGEVQAVAERIPAPGKLLPPVQPKTRIYPAIPERTNFRQSVLIAAGVVWS